MVFVQIFTNPSSPPVITFNELLNISLTLMQFTGPLWAFEFKTLCLPEQNVVISPRLVPNIASDYILFPTR